MASFSLNPMPKLQNKPLRTSAPRGRWNTRCLCAIVRHKTPSMQKWEEKRDRLCMSNPNPRKPELSSVFSLSKMSKPLLFCLRESFSLYASCKAYKTSFARGRSLHTRVWRGAKAIQLSKNICKSRWTAIGRPKMPSWPKRVPTGTKKCWPATKSAGRQTILPVAAKTSRWHLATAGGG